jgi:hypothetical protein
MSYTIFNVLESVCVGGALGGFANAILIGPLTTAVSRKTTFDPGFLKNVFVGIVAALAASAPNILGLNGKELTDGILVGAGLSAILIGVSGGRWLTARADERKVSDDNAKLKEAVATPDTRANLTPHTKNC